MNYKIFLILVLILPIVNATSEEKFVEINIEVEIDEGNLTIKTDSISDSSKEFHINNINENTTLEETYDWVIKTELKCTSGELTNYTKELTKVCNNMFNLSESCIRSFQNVSIMGFGYGGEDYKSRYETKESEFITCNRNLQIAKDNEKDPNSTLYLAIAIIVGAAGAYFYINRSKIKRSAEGRMVGSPPAPKSGVSTPLAEPPK